jgi:hypothetical protein
MIITSKNQKTRKYQMGGPAPEEAAAQEAPVEGGAPEGGENPMAQILQVAAQAVQSQNCEAAMAVCQALLELAQGGAPAEEPTFARRGAKLTRVR